VLRLQRCDDGGDRLDAPASEEGVREYPGPGIEQLDRLRARLDLALKELDDSSQSRDPAQPRCPYGQTVHTGRVVSVSSALVVIDVQESVLVGCADVPGVVQRISTLARRARRERVPVLFIQHEDPDDPELARDSPGWQLATALDRLDGDPVVPKAYRDSFTEAALADLLTTASR
jgi:hypothetical protein